MDMDKIFTIKNNGHDSKTLAIYITDNIEVCYSTMAMIDFEGGWEIEGWQNKFERICKERGAHIMEVVATQDYFF